MFQLYLISGVITGLCGGQLLHDVSKQICVDAGCNINGTAACKQDRMNNTQCLCYPGYSFNNKCGELDECKEHDPCKFGICINTIGSFRCECLPGKHGDHCNKEDTSFNCTIGYDMDHGNCTDIDECTYRSVSPCSRGGCVNTVGSYRCVCPPGWTGDRCNNDIQECTTGPCHNGKCTNTRGSFTCNCDPYWTGTLCDISLTPTKTSNSPPSTGYTSTTTVNSLTVTVNISRVTVHSPRSTFHSPTATINKSTVTTHSLRSSPQASTASPQDDISSTTENTVVIYVGDTVTVGVPISSVPDPLSDQSTNSEDPIDVGLIAGCITGGILAISAGALTVFLVYQFVIKRRGVIEPDQDTVIEVEQQATDNSESSLVKPGGHVIGIPRDGSYAMRTRFSIQRLFHSEQINERMKAELCECLPGKHGDHCNKEDTSFNCTIGYDMDHGNCTDIDECTYRSVSPCSRGGCVNTVGSYRCVCPPGWTGDRCNNDIQECTTGPCHNGKCTNTRGSFTCNCDPYWTGTLCDISLTPTKTSNSPPSTGYTSTTTVNSLTVTVNISRVTVHSPRSTFHSPTATINKSTVTTHSLRSSPQASTASPQDDISSTTENTVVIYVGDTVTVGVPISSVPDPLSDQSTNSEDPIDVGLIAGCITGGILAISAGALTVFLVYQFVIKRRGVIEPDQDTVIEVEQQATDNSESSLVKPGGHVIGIPRDGSYAMRTRFSIQRLFR